MIPAFTHERRRKQYYNHPKRGFGHINWEIEEELWRFQEEIEDKFKSSEINRMFKFPFTEDRDEKQLSG